MVPLVATNIKDALGNKLAVGFLTVLPTDTHDRPVTASDAGNGPILAVASAPLPVVNGAIPGGAQIPDTSSTTPPNISLRITITDAHDRPVYVLRGVQTTAAGLNLDVYQPNVAQQALIQYGPVGMNYRGMWQPNTTYAKRDALLYQGALYFAADTFTSGSTFSIPSQLLFLLPGGSTYGPNLADPSRFQQATLGINPASGSKPATWFYSPDTHSFASAPIHVKNLPSLKLNVNVAGTVSYQGFNYGQLWLDEDGGVLGTVQADLIAGSVLPVPAGASWFLFYYNYDGTATPPTNLLPSQVRVCEGAFDLAGCGAFPHQGGRSTGWVISHKGGPNAHMADFIVPTVGGEWQIKDLLDQLTLFAQKGVLQPTDAAPVANPQNGVRVFFDSGFTVKSPIVLDADNVEISGMQHAMWSAYKHPWTSKADPVSNIGPNCNFIALGDFPIFKVQYNNQVENRHRGICFHHLYLAGTNYTGKGIEMLGGGDDNCCLHDLVLEQFGIGLDLMLDSPSISRICAQDCMDAIHIQGYFVRLYDCLLFDCGGTAITANVANLMCHDNVIGHFAGDGIVVQNGSKGNFAYNNDIHNNQFAQNVGIGVRILSNSGHRVSHNTFDDGPFFSNLAGSPNTNPKVLVASGTKALVHGNTFTPTNGAYPGPAAQMANDASGMIDGNYLLGTYNGGTPFVAPAAKVGNNYSA